MSDVQMITLTEESLGKVQMLCGHSPTCRKGYEAKLEWMHGCIRDGMRYTLLQVEGRNAGMIEYLPGEVAWRGVEAEGYLFIHCLWVVGRNRKHGYGQQLLQACLQEAEGTNGVAVMTSRTHWLPTRKIFIKNGFEVTDELAPFELLVKRFKSGAPRPRFRRMPQMVAPGLALYLSDQYPYQQNMPLIVSRVGERLGIAVTITRLERAEAAQRSPCPYGVMGIFYNGELVEYRPVGTAKLLELVEPKVADHVEDV